MAQPAPAVEMVSRGAAKVMADIAEEMEVLESLGADPSMDEPMMEDASAPMDDLMDEYEAAPPPPAMAAPPRPAPRASAMAPGGGGYPPSASRMPPAPPSIPPLAAPKSAPMAKRARSVTREMASPDLARRQNRLAEPPPPAEVELGSGLLDYGRLFMAGPEEGMARGKLRPATQGEAWELEVYSRVSIRLEVETLVALRKREASAVANLPRPQHAWAVRSAAGSYDYRFDAERRVDVAGDGVWHTVPVATAEVLISPEYVCVPSVDPKVYRTVNVRNVSRHALLAGPMDVTLGDEFLMTVPMPTLAPGGEERVGLGVEEGVKVSRNTRFNEAQGGLFGGAAVLEHGVEIEVANRLAQAIHVEVQERVPVTSEKDIKIEETQVQPAWTPNDKPLNGVRVEGARAWRVKLGANEAKKLSAQYAIRIPNQKVLVGGNRRV
ncbi:MAG TPA: DUF4139 domain-containing protein, partial [Myxococcaceae bacterium]|nr:DUF4139 domain-containing protein [Myxococcaceae bacterium]